MKHSFSEYLLRRDEEMAFYVLEQSLQNEGLNVIKGLKGIWNMARGGKYNRDDAKNALNTSNIIANIPDIAAAGKGIFHTIRNLGLSGAMAMGGGGDANYKPPEPTPIVKAYTPPVQQQSDDEDDPASYDIYRSAKGSRVSPTERVAQKFGRAASFADLENKKKRFSMDFIDQMPSA